MQKWMGVLAVGFLAASLMLTMSCKPAEPVAGSYAEDRAQIEDLQARYLFALDFFDMDTYVSTFTKDGFLDIIAYQAKGRAEIRKKREEARPVFDQSAAKDAKGPYRATGRHNITNIVLKIEGNKAFGGAYWFHYGNNNPERRAAVDAYGHYEDELVKANGKWLLRKRVIYNESVAEWIAPAKNPSW